MTSPSPSPEPSSGSPSAPSGHPPDDGGSVSPRVRNGIAVAITTVWAAGMTADVAMSTFAAPAAIHAIMLGLAASVFGSNFVKGLRP